MKNFLPVLCASPLFSGIAEADAAVLLASMDARTVTYEKGSYLLHAGDSVSALGFLLSGRVLIVKEDFWGGRNLIASLSEGQCFAETFACVGDAPMAVSVVADSACSVLYLNIQKLLQTEEPITGAFGRLLQNLLGDMARKNLAFNEKLSHLGQRTTRGKILSYLSAEARRQHSERFDIPLNRQQLADYLLVERSGLSVELSRMQGEGLIDYQKNHFVLKGHKTEET